MSVTEMLMNPSKFEFLLDVQRIRIFHDFLKFQIDSDGNYVGKLEEIDFSRRLF